MAKRNFFIRVLEWLGHFETIQAIIQAEFIRTLLVPTVTALATGGAGILGGLPLMWIFMATAVAGASAAIGILNASTYLERKNPAYKLQVVETVFSFDLFPISAPNRKQRKAATAQGGSPAIPAFRHLVRGQLGFRVGNRASFPISIIAFAAETEIEGLKPPRAKFPKKPMIIQPGAILWIHDDPIAFDNMICGNLDGIMDMTIKYGLPGKEHFEIVHKGTVEIFMEPYGLMKQVYFHPASSES